MAANVQLLPAVQLVLNPQKAAVGFEPTNNGFAISKSVLAAVRVIELKSIIFNDLRE
jgi:hypothetical protein